MKTFREVVLQRAADGEPLVLEEEACTIVSSEVERCKRDELLDADGQLTRYGRAWLRGATEGL